MKTVIKSRDVRFFEKQNSFDISAENQLKTSSYIPLKLLDLQNEEHQNLRDEEYQDSQDDKRQDSQKEY